MKIVVACSRNEQAKENKRFILYAPGNAELIDGSTVFKYVDLASNSDANGVFFDYRFYNEKGEQIKWGINRELIVRAHHLALQFIEKEMQATEIVLIGRSLGGGVQAESLDGQQKKGGVRYVTVSLDTFSELKELVRSMIGKWFGGLASKIVDYYDWNLKTAECLSKAEVPNIVIQASGYVSRTQEENTFTQEVIYDGLIHPKGALAPALSDKKTPNTTYFGIPYRSHNDYACFELWGVFDKIQEILSN